MELEVLARHYGDRAPQVINGRLVARKLIQIPNSHVAAQIQLAEFAPPDSESAAGIELSENNGVPVRRFRKFRLVVGIILVLTGALTHRRWGLRRRSWCRSRYVVSIHPANVGALTIAGIGSHIP